jgi:hypothetical protein
MMTGTLGNLVTMAIVFAIVVMVGLGVVAIATIRRRWRQPKD